jgi:hypothetical protein
MELQLPLSPLTASRPAEASRLGGRGWRAVQRARSLAPSNVYDLMTCLFISAVAVIALCTVGDYAISNDEGVQHHYGELIVAYYRSLFADRALFAFHDLYLYGGLFDVIAVALARVIPCDPYDLRHVLCALFGVGGIVAAAATARLIAGPRAGLIAAVALTLCGAWYGAMFNHTKDIPFASAMMGATLFLVRIGRLLPSPRRADVLAFGLLAGAALGLRSIGLLLFGYLGLAVLVYLPWRDHGPKAWRFAAASAWKLVPALALAYLIMIAAWPWAALSPLNPVRGLYAFSAFHYDVRTMFAGQVYAMADVPRIYVPVYLAIRMPLIMLAGAALALASLLHPSFVHGWKRRARDVALVALTILVPLACQVAFRGPAFTGIRHFLFVVPPLAVLAGIGLDGALAALARRSRRLAASAVALVCACFVWDAAILVRLHPYENLSYNALVGGVPGAFRRYDLDYWFNSMPEAIRKLEAYLREGLRDAASLPQATYSVAVCGERPSFDRTVTLPQLQWDFRDEWEQSEFFIAPTQMNCDRDLDGDAVAVVERLGVPIAYVKDRRAIAAPTVRRTAGPTP